MAPDDPASAASPPRAAGLHPAATRLLPRDRAGGTAAVQFALVLPVFLGLTLGIMDMGRLVWTQVTIAQAATKAGRFAMARGSTSEAPATAEQVAAYAKNQLPGLAAASATVSVSWSPNNKPGSAVAVEVSYPFEFVALGLLGLAPLSLGSTSITTITN